MTEKNFCVNLTTDEWNHIKDIIQNNDSNVNDKIIKKIENKKRSTIDFTNLWLKRIQELEQQLDEIKDILMD